MHNLKQRLDPIRLTEQQKQRIKANAKKQQKKQHSFIPIVLPAFIVLTIFFIFINFSPNGFSIIGKTTATNNVLFQNTSMSLRVFIWNITNTVWLILMYIYFKKSLKETARWQNDERMQEWHAFFSKPLRSKGLLIACVCFLWIGAFLFSNLWYSQTVFVFLTVILVTIKVMYDVRDRDWSTCPHCNVKFTRKQITNKSFNAFREKCDACQQLIYVNPKENQRKATFFLIPLMPMSLHLFDLHFILLVLLVILSIISLSYFYVPYMIRFSDKDTSMDDWKK